MFLGMELTDFKSRSKLFEIINRDGEIVSASGGVNI